MKTPDALSLLAILKSALPPIPQLCFAICAKPPSAFSSQLSVKTIINRLPRSTADMKETWANISKAKRLLGWSPLISRAGGFKYAVEWHEAHACIHNLRSV